MQKRKMNYKAVFADLDRTLLNGEGHISEFTKKTIEKLLKSGVDFVPCSGRSLMSFPKEIFEIRGIKHGVSSNGVSVDNLEEKKIFELSCDSFGRSRACYEISFGV